MCGNWSAYFNCLSHQFHAECDHNHSPEDNLIYELHVAAGEGNLRRLKKALRNVPDVNSTDSLGQTALHFACRNGKPKCVKAILDFKPDVNMKDDAYCTPLNVFLECFQCHKSGSKPILEMLLNAGADPNTIPIDGMAPLHIAAENFTGIMPLRFAQMLINHNADINLQGSFQNTPLHFAVYSRNTPVIELLLKNGADMNIKNRSDLSPIQVILSGVDGNLDGLMCLGEHLIRQYCCGTPVYKKHLDAVCLIPSLQTFRKNCEREVWKLKECKFSGFNITYYDILRSTPTKIAKYMQNSSLFDSLVNLDATGYIFEEQLIRKISEALKKHKAYLSGYKFFGDVLPILPEICVNIIIEYLDDTDLINMGRIISC